MTDEDAIVHEDAIVLRRRDAMVGTALGILPPGTRTLTATEKHPLPPYPDLRLVRGYPLGFWCRVPRRQVAQIVCRTEHVFRGTHLLLPSSMTETFKLLDVRIRYWSQLVVRKPPPPMARAGRMSSLFLPEMRAAEPGEDISLTVENQTDEAQMFMAALVGMAAR